MTGSATPAQAPQPRAPNIVSQRADEEFQHVAASLGHQRGTRWIDGYVQFEWTHGRWFLDGAFTSMAGKRVLEFGCNVGATAIVLGALGAQVEGVDVGEEYVRLARLNVARFGQGSSVRLHHVTDSAHLPWPDASFDVITCISVLEYIPAPQRGEVLCELDRLLRPGGHLFILGTSNRLWPVELHTRRWLVNYLPYRLAAALASRPFQQGVNPYRLRRLLAGYRNLCREGDGRPYFAAKRLAGLSQSRLRLLRALDRLAGIVGLSASEATSSINVVLQKPRPVGWIRTKPRPRLSPQMLKPL